MEKAKSKFDGLIKLGLAGLALYIIDDFGRRGALPAGLVPSNAIPAFFTGIGDWFNELGVFAPIALLILLFCVDGMTGKRR